MLFLRSLRWVAVASLALLTDRAEEQWPQFRGVGGAGVAAPEARPPLEIGPNENVKWGVSVPFSPSSPCIWGERIFLTTYLAPNLEVRCYERATGALRWTRAFTPEQVEEFHSTDGSPAASMQAHRGRGGN